MSINLKRKKRITHFVDKYREVMSEFYDLTDSILSEKKLLKEMHRLIETDPDFYDSYLVASD